VSRVRQSLTVMGCGRTGDRLLHPSGFIASTIKLRRLSATVTMADPYSTLDAVRLDGFKLRGLPIEVSIVGK
jgi:hypothetical protein